MQVKRQLSKEMGSEGRKEKVKEGKTKKIKQVKEMIEASATTLSNVHADCGTEGLLTHCTGRPCASQTPHGHLGLLAPTLQSCPASSVAGTMWLACHLASLAREKPAPGKPPYATHRRSPAPTSALGATTVPPQGSSPPWPCQGGSETGTYCMEVCCGLGREGVQGIYRRVMADGDSER